VVDEVGYVPFDPEAAALSLRARIESLHAPEPDRQLKRTFQRVGRVRGDDAVAAMVDWIVRAAPGTFAARGDGHRRRGKRRRC
jgi:hypothetical protein